MRVKRTMIRKPRSCMWFSCNWWLTVTLNGWSNGSPWGYGSFQCHLLLVLYSGTSLSDLRSRSLTTITNKAAITWRYFCTSLNFSISISYENLFSPECPFEVKNTTNLIQDAEYLYKRRVFFCLQEWPLNLNHIWRHEHHLPINYVSSIELFYDSESLMT